MAEDRISSLQDDIIHCIYSFLDMRVVLLTTLLSRRWRYIWLSNPYINIDRDYSSYYNDDSYMDIDYKFINIVNQVLHRRRSSSIILKFSLTLSGWYFDRTWKVDEWVNSVLSRNVQEVSLEAMDIKYYTLKTLASEVKSLKLKRVCFVGVDSEKLLLSSEVMETLVICKLYLGKTLSISMPSVKHLLFNFGGESGCEPVHAEVHAPNLTLLQIKGCICKGFSLENLSSIVTAEIDHDYCWWRVKDQEKLENLAWCLTNILKGLPNVKSLTLPANIFQAFTNLPNWSKEVLHKYHNLRYLKLRCWSCKSPANILGLVELVVNIPHVETLVMEREEQVFISNAKDIDWKEQLSLQCVFPHLKSIEMRYLEGCEQELRFLELLVKNAIVLDNITIKTIRSTSIEKENEMADFSRKLQYLPIASSSVTIFFNGKLLIENVM